MNARFVVRPLGEEHELDAFDCGQADLTAWLRDHARHARRQGTRTYVVTEEGQADARAYFAIAPFLVERDELPSRLGRGAPQRVPAVLLAKLALDIRLQGQGLGSELLVRALTTVVTAARAVGGKLVVVDAIDDAAAAFYRRHDFIPVPGRPRHLVQKLSTVAKALDLDWP